MKLSFTKMHGYGNDYIYFDVFSQTIADPEALSVRLSDRHFGIGGDGIVLICPSDIADAKMRMFNADGSEGRMCGNAIRCVGRYLYDRKGIKKPVVTVETLSGIKTLTMGDKDSLAAMITVDMGPAEFTPSKIPVLLEGDQVINRRVMLAGKEQAITCVGMGSPHCVIEVDDVSGLDLEAIGPAHEWDPLFPERVNTEFFQKIDDHRLKMRVWERGSGETLACGTGSCATVVAAVAMGMCPRNEPVIVEILGGELTITVTDDTVWMQGGTTFVFDGEVEA